MDDAVAASVADGLLRFGRLGRPMIDPLPVNPSKITRPYLRADVLSRERLNGWLDKAVNGRLALVIGEAGFGKTTFLADWATRTARRSSWYALASEDRDWLTFIRHLVASGRLVDAGFASATYQLLGLLGPGGPTAAELTTSLADEIAAFGAASAEGFSIIFDDFHEIEANPETDSIVAALLARTGPGFSLVIASRTAPALPPRVMKGRGGVARIDGEDLCFNVPETDRLFREAYSLPLDGDVVRDLVARTDGWAALISLFRTSLAERTDPDPRALVTQMTATTGDLYDFLADEVLAVASPVLQMFLMYASVLDEVSRSRVALLTEDSGTVGQIAVAESMGLLLRIPGSDLLRFAPLVRDFLQSRTVATYGRGHLDHLHELAAQGLESTDWVASARQYAYAGLSGSVGRVIGDSVDAVLGQGEYRVALDLLSRTLDRRSETAVGLVLRSRLALQSGDTDSAMTLAEAAVRLAGTSDPGRLGAALQNAASINMATYRFSEARGHAKRAVDSAQTGHEKSLAEIRVALFGVSGAASLAALAEQLEALLIRHRRVGQRHYEAVTSLNLAQLLVWLDRPREAFELASRAEETFRENAMHFERAAVLVVKANSLALLGDWQSAAAVVNDAINADHPEAEAEAVLESSEIAAWFGPKGFSERILQRVRRTSLPDEWARLWMAVDLWNSDQHEEIRALLEHMGEAPPESMEPGSEFRWHLSLARAALVIDDSEVMTRALRSAEAISRRQASPIQRRLTQLASAFSKGEPALSSYVGALPPAGDLLLGVFARETVARLDEVTPEAFTIVSRAAGAYPARWHGPVRDAVAVAPPGGTRAAQLLEAIGSRADVELLRAFGKRQRRQNRDWGAALLRRLAPRLFVYDLGFVSLRLGEKLIDGRGMRRKALALLTFLLAQPRGSATPDQLIDALWPDLEPTAATNSLHQTIYFLRRVIDEEYKAGRSPEYLHFESETVWLDRDLVDAASWRCSQLLTRSSMSEDEVRAILQTYGGQWAADFLYEDWASAYRETLHASFLSAMERIVLSTSGAESKDWRIWVGQRTLLVEPNADAIEAEVIRIYRDLGSSAAAARQYAHYSAAMRDQLGIEPPPLSQL